MRRSTFPAALICIATCHMPVYGQKVPASSQAATAPAAVDPELWSLMSEIDERVGRINDLRADFEQQKHTALLKKPLTSTGEVLVKGSVTLWTTRTPEPTVMLMGAEEIHLYYPEQAAMEIYPIRGRLGALAASPLPRLAVLREFFSFERIPVTELAPDGDEETALALRMTPTDESLREHVQEVCVLLSRRSGFIERAETLDSDGERTVILFKNIRVNTGLNDDQFRIDTPAGTTVTRPLDGLGETPAPPGR